MLACHNAPATRAICRHVSRRCVQSQHVTVHLQIYRRVMEDIDSFSFKLPNRQSVIRDKSLLEHLALPLR